MTRQIINIGTGPDSYTGDNLRVAFTKVNDNFAQLYAGNVGANTTVNVLSANSVATNGNINAGNVNVQYQVVSNGNITAAYFIGDGSQISNLPAGNYSNTNVASYLPTYSGDVNAAYYFGNGRNLTGIVATADYSNSNVASYLPVYSGNINAAYYFGNGSQLTGITTANLGNLYVGGPTAQTLIGSTAGPLALRPYDGSGVSFILQYDASGTYANTSISSTAANEVTLATLANLKITSGNSVVKFDRNTGGIVFSSTSNELYNFSFVGEVTANAYYASANFPVGYSFTTPAGDTGLSHEYDTTNGNISVMKLRHDNAEVAKFYENLTSVLSGNLVISQTGNVFGSFPNAFIQAYSSANTYTQMTWQNLNNGSAATGDIVVTADTGTDTTYYIDMGMTGSGYDNTNPNNSLGSSVNALDGYFYVQGNTGATGGNLTLGTTTPGTNVKILVGGVNAANIVAAFNNTGLMPGANVTYDLGSATAQWRDLWLSNNTMYLGGVPVTVANGALSVNGAAVSGTYTNTNVAAFLSAFGSNGITTTGNINANINASYVRANGLYGTIADDTAFLSNASGLIRVLVQNNGINIQTYDHPNLNYHTWTFNSVGDLYLPSNNGGIYRANGQPYSAASYGNSNVAEYLPTYTGNIGASNIAFTNDYVYTGNTFISPETNGILKNFKWKFSDTATGADTVTLQWNLLDTTFSQWYLTTNSQGNIYVFDGDAKTIGFLDNGINSGTVTFGTAANNGTGGSNDIELTTVTGNAYVRTGSNSWVFDNDGVLNLPGNTAFLYSTANAVYLNSDSTTYNSIDIVANGDTILRNQRAVKIVADSDGSGHNWAFNANGNLTLPTNSSTITYANGTSILSGLGGNVTQIVNGNTSVYIPTEGGDITFQRLGTNYGHIGTGLAIGYIAGNSNQGISAVALGTGAGTENQGYHAVAVGWNVGQYDQGAGAIAIGENPGYAAQGNLAIAIGTVAGRASQGSYAIAMGVGAGYSAQTANAVAIGTRAGQDTQGQDAVAIGLFAGNSSQGGSSVALGSGAGKNSQGGGAVALGAGAGQTNQGAAAIAIGNPAGAENQGEGAIAIGTSAAQTSQGTGAIAIGTQSGAVNQGQHSIAIGTGAAGTGIQPNNSIILSATGTLWNGTESGFYVAPIRNVTSSNVMGYDPDTKEITYNDSITVANLNVSSNITFTNGPSGIVGFSASPGSFISGFDSITAANISMTVGGNIGGYDIGYRDIPQIVFTSNITLAPTASGKHYYSANSANVITIPNNSTVSFNIGTAITVVQQGTANLTISPGSGVTLYLAGNSTSAARTLGNYGMATLMKVATDTWFINGTGVN